MPLSPNMNLVIPSVGVTAGPQYASDVNASLTIIDTHDHSLGLGVQITPSGLDINADLSMGDNNLTDSRSLRLSDNITPISNPADIGCLYRAADDLYYNDGSGNEIRITQAGAVVGTPGSITGLVAPASATYTPIDGTFTWESAVNTSADMDFGSAILRNGTVSSFGLTLSPPILAANYTITLPQLPAETSLMIIDTAGNITTFPTSLGLTPVGSMLDFGGTTPPPGWLLCDGSAVSRTTYAGLFSVLGILWGSGDGSTTFNLPDFRRRVAMGSGGTGTATIGNAVGNTGGEENHILTTSELATHTHTILDPGHSHDVQTYSSGGGSAVARVAAATSPEVFNANVGTVTNTTGITAADNGSSLGHNTIQPSAIVLKIIKY